MKELVKKLVPVAMAMPLEFEWRPHEYGGQNRVRVWKSTWGGDQFEVLTQHEFAAFQSMCHRFSIMLTKADEES